MGFSIDVSSLFGYATAVVDSMLPVAYVFAGIFLGFVVVFKINSALR